MDSWGKRCAGVLAAMLMGSGLMQGTPLPAEETGSARTIHLKQDDAQVRFESKVYELKHAKAEELLPFVQSAILRYDVNSTIRRVTSQDGKQDALLVSTGCNFLPMVDKIVEALDHPGVEGRTGSISGTGLSRIAYTPSYRSSEDFVSIINRAMLSASGLAGTNSETNTIFWRDQKDNARRVLGIVKTLDRPLPQVRVRLNYYELRDSDLKDWGFDYLAWKNGPGVNLLNVGYDAGGIVVDELLSEVPYAFTSSWGLGGVFTAPQIDMSFIRCLQQSGNASAVASTSLLMINTPVGSENDLALLRRVQEENPAKAPFIYRISMQPEYQNIAKNVLGRSFVGKSFYEDELGIKHADPPSLEATIVNPFVCVPEVPGRTSQNPDAGGVIFDYALYFKSVVERGNTGAELSNTALLTGSATLGFNHEKVLAVYNKENDVEQTLGLPVLCRIPYLKYLFSTVTTIKERTYIVITAEAIFFDPEKDSDQQTHIYSAATAVERRIENPFHSEEDKEETEKPTAGNAQDQN